MDRNELIGVMNGLDEKLLPATAAGAKTVEVKPRGPLTEFEQRAERIYGARPAGEAAPAQEEKVQEAKPRLSDEQLAGRLYPGAAESNEARQIDEDPGDGGKRTAACIRDTHGLKLFDSFTHTREQLAVSNGPSLADADLGGLRFNSASSSFRDAKMQRVSLRNAKCDGVDFTNADLRGADLRGASLRGCQLHFTDLADVLVDETTDLTGASLLGTGFTNNNIRAARGFGTIRSDRKGR